LFLTLVLCCGALFLYIYFSIIPIDLQAAQNLKFQELLSIVLRIQSQFFQQLCLVQDLKNKASKTVVVNSDFRNRMEDTKSISCFLVGFFLRLTPIPDKNSGEASNQ